MNGISIIEDSGKLSERILGGFQSKTSTGFDALPKQLFETIKAKLGFLTIFNFCHWWVSVNRKGAFNQLDLHPIPDV